jgi:GH15 family glucan-1,4-alpha-glucosidase
MRLYSGSNVLARQPGDHLGNFPQALTHAAVVQAALALRAEGG